MKNETKTRRPVWVYILGAVALVAIIDVILFAVLHSREKQGETTEGSTSEDSAMEGSDLIAGDAQSDIQSDTQTQTENVAITLERGLEIRRIGAYTGPFVEDGTDEAVSGVLMLEVENTGTDYIQYGEITASDGNNVGTFMLSTLAPGERAVLLEQDRLAYTVGTEYDIQTNNIAVFSEIPSMEEDKIEITALDGALNIKNISGADISGDVVVYYKNYSGGLYYGGITYRVRIEGGMEADEIRQVMSDHFASSGSRVVFVTVE